MGSLSLFCFPRAVFPISRAVSKLSSHARSRPGKSNLVCPEYTPCPRKGQVHLLDKISLKSGCFGPVGAGQEVSAKSTVFLHIFNQVSRLAIQQGADAGKVFHRDILLFPQRLKHTFRQQFFFSDSIGIVASLF